MKRHPFLVAIVLVCILAANGSHTSQANAIPRLPDLASLANIAKVETALPPWKFENNQDEAYNGYVVASAGDVNHDGYADVIIGDRQFGTSDTGRAYLFYGSAAGLPATPSVIINPPVAQANGFFGDSVGYAGDFNCDSIDDFYVAEENYADEGAIYIYYGSNTGPGATYNWMARGNATYAHFGTAAGTAGDINKDGCDDIIVGATRYDYVNVNHAFVWYGSSSNLRPTGIALGSGANPDWYAQNATGVSWTYPHGAGPYFGASVGTAGDVNGDGYDDIIVGAFQTPDYPSAQGAAYVWYGSKDGLGDPGTISNADWKAECKVDGCRLGMSVGTAGDVNGDGYDDVIIGAPYYSHPEASEGAAFVWYGGPDGLGDNGTPANADWVTESNQGGALQGWSAHTAGDINADGYDDVIVGDYGYDVVSPSLVDGGAVFVWLGSPTGLGAGGTPANAYQAFYCDKASCLMGNSVATAGDVNKDGADDLIFSAFYYSDPESHEGAVWVNLSTPWRRFFLPLVSR